MSLKKPSLSFSQIINMNVGFFGIQYSFGLQQSAVNPIYDFLGASPDEIPLLNLAGPITGLLIQPFIGALSDSTWHPKWGRRKPYFFIGALLCSICLLLYPFSSSLRVLNAPMSAVYLSTSSNFRRSKIILLLVNSFMTSASS